MLFNFRARVAQQAAAAHDEKRLMRRYDRQLCSLRQQQERAVRRLQRCAARRNSSGIQQASLLLASITEELRILERLLPRHRVRQQGEHVLVCSSWTLRDSFLTCTATPDEGMHFLVGIDIDGMAVVTRPESIPYSHRSFVAARGELVGTNRALIQIHEAGHRLLALMHSQPGKGPDATLPSSVDKATQEAFEATTCMISGIWSRDGWLRWFGVNKKFQVQVLGNHMEQVDDLVYRLKQKNPKMAVHAAAHEAVCH